MNAAVGAASSLSIGTGDSVSGALLSGHGPVDLAAQGSAAAITTAGDVDLAVGATISGDVVAGGTITAPSNAIRGSERPRSGTTATTVGWTVTLPAQSQGALTLNSGTVGSPAPARYDTVEVHSGSDLYLRTGAYYFQDLILHTGGTLFVDSRNGPVLLYVTSSIMFNGMERSVDDGLARLFVQYLGTANAALKAPFSGVFLAPSATLHLQHDVTNTFVNVGTFYGATFLADPGEVIRPAPFDWTSIPGFPIPPGGWTVQNPVAASNAPVTTISKPAPAFDLRVGVDSNGAGTTFATAQAKIQAPYTLPDQFEVSGEIANGTAVVTCTPASGPPVTCTYQGQASSALPTAILDLEAGRLLKSIGCSDGQPVAVQRTALTCSLHVTPAPGWRVQVHLPLDDRACTGDFELLTGLQTRQMHDSFNWATAPQHVDETNPDGTPTLYYAWVYGRTNDVDLLNLHKMFVHVLPYPLFTQELVQHAGRCGTYRNPGDGEGSMIPVLMPGLVYNKLVEVQSAPNITGNRILFDAVILRNSEVPAAARNANGSVSLAALRSAHFSYLGYEPQPLPAQSDIQLNGAVVAAAIKAASFVLDAVQATGHVITEAIGDIDALIADRVKFDMTIGAFNNGPGFNAGPMIRTWGTHAGRQVGAGGMNVQLLENADFFPAIPETFSGSTDDDGHVTIFPAKHGASDVRGNGICITEENDAVRMTDSLTADALCDFTEIVPVEATPDGGSVDGGIIFESGAITDFASDKTLDVIAEDARLAIAYQTTDAAKYSLDVMHYIPPTKSHVLVGPLADFIGNFNQSRAITMCFHERNTAGNILDSIVMPFAQVIGGGGLSSSDVLSMLVPIVSNIDTIVPDSSASEEREVGSHEYGHFLICNLIHDIDPNGVDRIVNDSVSAWADSEITSGFATGNDYTFPIRYVNEAWADFISGQVTGIANYTWLTGGGAQPGGARPNNVCSIGGNPCFDFNYDTALTDLKSTEQNNDPSNIARIAGMLHDAFDGQGANGGLKAKDQVTVGGMLTNVSNDIPNNADPWTVDTGNSTLYDYTPIPWGNFDSTLTLAGAGPDGGAGLTHPFETVALSGQAIQDVAHGFAVFRSPPAQGLDYLTDISVMQSLAQAMVAQNLNWCQMCPVFALHSPGRPATPSIRDLLNLCNGGDPNINFVMGNAPVDPTNLRIDGQTCKACPPNQTSDANGDCQPCAFTVVGDSCDQCFADKTIDGNVDLFDPLPAGGVSTTTQAPNDNCPQVFWLQINNPDGYFRRAMAASPPFTTAFTADLVTAVQSVCTTPQTLLFQQQPPGGGLFASGPNITATGVFNPGGGAGCDAALCLPASCSGLPVNNTITSVTQLPVGMPTGSIRFGSASQADLFLDFHAFMPSSGGGPH